MSGRPRGGGGGGGGRPASTAFAFGGTNYTKADQKPQSDERQQTVAAAPRRRKPAAGVSAAGKSHGARMQMAAAAGSAGSAGSASRGPPSGAYRQSHGRVDEELQPSQPPSRPSLAAALIAAPHRPAGRRDSDGGSDDPVDADSGSGGAHLGGGGLGRLSSPMTAARPSAAMVAARNLQALEREKDEVVRRVEAEAQRVNALEAPARERFDRLRAAGGTGGSSFYSGPPPHTQKFPHTSGPAPRRSTATGAAAAAAHRCTDFSGGCNILHSTVYLVVAYSADPSECRSSHVRALAASSASIPVHRPVCWRNRSPPSGDAVMAQSRENCSPSLQR
jgi:hypothetical protein